ncbi:MAG: Amylo-alpha6-glucosidase [Myxococcales bacterium]|nr:Amylo-alpha6-glucosidase [Myxococcales bacterium]
MSEQPRLLPDLEIALPVESSLELPVSGQTDPLVLARGNAFCVTSSRGDIAPAGARDLGLFHDDTRHLSYLELFVSGGPPVVLSSDIISSASSQVDLTLTDREFGGFLEDPQNFLHIRRKQILDGALVEQLVITNHLRRPVKLWLELRLGADFADVFEVRGARRARRGRILPPHANGDRLELGYEGLDGEHYRTLVRMNPEPTRLDGMGPRWELELSPGEATMLEVVIQPRRGDDAEVALVSFTARRDRLKRDHEDFSRGCTRISGSNVAFDAALKHNLDDIDGLRLTLAGPEPMHILGAGIPWFAAPFGRDSIITSLELLSVTPSLAIETLRTLAHFQGRVDDPWREEEPGKIMHELRRGEMARSGEIPHAPYYGTIDATPLWLVLLGETWKWTADRGLVRELWPHAERALDWIERRLRQGNGWVRYQRTHEKGLENQGWKDSRDGVSFPDGTVAHTPIALIEVQGYVVGALDVMSHLSRELGNPRRADQLAVSAAALRRRIFDEFYVRESSFWALALDGENRPVPTITSNPGHLLFVDAAPADRTSRLVDVLMSDGMFNGWGVRTLARGQAVFNPISYHNGSVWPHDNAICALGAARHGRGDAALRILEGLYHASLHFRRGRLPELFCGLSRGEGETLVHYPVSCSPQAWASGAFFLLLQACLGLTADAPARRLTIRDPRLPAFLERLDLLNLSVGASKVSLHFARHGSRTHVDVLEVTGDELRVTIEV